MFRVTQRRRLAGFACCLILQLPFLAEADPADAIVGDWLVKSGDVIVRVERHNDLYSGNIVWQLHDKFSAQDGPELDGKPATDIFNPDPALRSRPMDGLLLLWDLHYDAEHHDWTGGRVYDSNNGHTFSCQMHLVDPDHLKIRGYFGISLLGGSSVWTRVTKVPP
jgi:uncharacterized protein (DUF2147 family)